MTRIAFYGPIKPPDHPIPSGDRLIAQNTIKALERAGFTVELASRFIAYSKRDSGEILKQRKEDALIEAERVIERLSASPPDLFLTYHPYCKAPDWIGPRVSKALNIPYVTLEAARTGQGFENGGDRWKSWREEAQAGIKCADLHLCFKPTDRAYLKELLKCEKTLADIAPFIDTTQPAGLTPLTLPSHWRPEVPVLITVGMMRAGKKVENFRLLAEALSGLQALTWNLVVVGGGPEEEVVGGFFKDFNADRLHFTGVVEPGTVLSAMAGADLFVWPGWKEPIGMVYLEAQNMGLPVAALKSMGVPLVVHHGETGLLANEDDIDGLSQNMATLISHPALRDDLGAAAAKSVKDRHSLQAAANRLNELLTPLVMPQ